MADPKTKGSEVDRRLGVTTTTLYAYVNGHGSANAPGQRFPIASKVIGDVTCIIYNYN